MTDMARLRAGRDRTELRQRLAAWLARRLPGAMLGELEVPESNGLSSETVLFEVTWHDAEGEHRQRCAARLSPEESAAPVFPVYDLWRQFEVMRLVGERSAAPVPTTLWYEPDRSALGTPFFVMERVDGLVPADVMPYPFGSWLSEASAQDQRRLQDAALRTLAAIHQAEVSPRELSFLELDRPGASALRRHVADTAAYYEWVVSDGARSPLVERCFAWLEDHWPAQEAGATISWGDSRIGNMVFRDFEPVAVLDWEMAATAPPEVDLGWMIYMHRWLDDIALEAGLEGMPGFMQRDQAAATYEEASGHTPRDLDFYCLYAALRMAVVISRVGRRRVLFGEMAMPEDPDELIMHRASLEAMLEGSYWSRF
jgi:aminoglycoside phosphotransferase (APT) family kinase protein